MGRPRKLTTTLQPKKEVDDEAQKGLRASKQGKYTNWF